MPPILTLTLLALAPLGAVAAVSDFTGTTTAEISSPDADVVVEPHTSIVSLLDVDVVGEVLAARVTIDLQHTRPSQVATYLVAPDGTTVTLTTHNGGSADHIFSPVTFDDHAPVNPDDEDGPGALRHVRNVAWDDGVSIGTVQPEGALGALTGSRADGPWALVLVQDGYERGGVLRSWSLELTTLTGIPFGEDPAGFGWTVPLPVPTDRTPLELPVTVTGLSGRVLDVDVDVSLTDIDTRDAELYLTSPTGTRIELVTRVGDYERGRFDAVTFDDDATSPITDIELPEDGSPFQYGAVVPEGALGAFLGESANGDWTLSIVDRGYDNGATLASWTLHLTTVGSCGNGILDTGEECDDGNGGNGDGCDADCRPSRCGNGLVGIDEGCDDGNTHDGDGCSSTCQLPERACDDCIDNDGNGLADGADPNCADTPLRLKRARLNKRGRLIAKASGPASDALVPGAVTVVVSDAEGIPVCTVLPVPELRRGALVTEGTLAGGGTITVQVRQGRRTTLVVKGRDLSGAALDKTSAGVGIQMSGRMLGGGKPPKRTGRR